MSEETKDNPNPSIKVLGPIKGVKVMSSDGTVGILVPEHIVCAECAVERSESRSSGRESRSSGRTTVVMGGSREPLTEEQRQKLKENSLWTKPWTQRN